MRQKKLPQKRLTKRMYVYLGFVTMAAVNLFSKPIKRGISALEKRLKGAAQQGGRRSLRQSLSSYSENKIRKQERD